MPFEAVGIFRVSKHLQILKIFKILKMKGPRKACFFFLRIFGIFGIFKILKKAENSKIPKKTCLPGAFNF